MVGSGAIKRLTLAPIRGASASTISQLKAPEGGKNMGGIHMGASAAFLNGTGPVGNNGDFNLIESKKSVDQYIADAIAGYTPQLPAYPLLLARARYSPSASSLKLV